MMIENFNWKLIKTEKLVKYKDFADCYSEPLNPSSLETSLLQYDSLAKKKKQSPDSPEELQKALTTLKENKSLVENEIRSELLN